MLSSHRNNLCRHHSHRFIVPENNRVTGNYVVRSVPFNDAQIIRPEKNASSQCHPVPGVAVEKIHAVGKCEPKSAWTMPLLVALTYLAQGRCDFMERITGLK